MLLTSWVNQCLFPTSQQCPSRDSMMFYGRTPRKTTSLVYDIWIPMCWYVGESKSKGALFFSLLIRTFVQKWKKLVLCSLPQWLFIWKYLCIHWIQVLLFSGEYHCWSSNWHSQFHWIVHWDFDYSMQNETASAKDIALHLRISRSLIAGCATEKWELEIEWLSGRLGNYILDFWVSAQAVSRKERWQHLLLF